MEKTPNEPVSQVHAASTAEPRPSILSVTLHPSVVRRALGYAVVVAAILTAINHGDSLLSGDISHGQLFQMLLTLCVPYCVSTASSLGAIRSRAD